MTKKWSAFPHPAKAFTHDAASLKKGWARLHRGDCESWPKDGAVVEAWRAYHAGDYAAAVQQGRAAGASGLNAAIKAQTVYANHLETRDAARIGLLEEAYKWADERRTTAPKDANAHYLYAFALGRYSQRISVTKALAQGYGGKIKEALAMALRLAPAHAEAHTAFGAYQAEIIDKVGALVGGMTYGAKKDSALASFRKALELFPESPIAHIEHANGLILMYKQQKLEEATKLYEKASALEPADAMEKLDVELARAELE